MFRLRRFRLFLFIAVISIFTIYELTRVYSGDSSDLQLLKDLGLHHDVVKTTLPQPPAQVPLPTRSAPVQIAASSTSSAIDEETTITGEELLAQRPTHEDDLVQQAQGRLEVNPRPSSKPKARWTQQKQHFPVRKVISMPKGEAQPLPKIQHKFGPETSAKKAERVKKQIAVREAFKHAWAGYKQYAYGHDELRPLTNTSADTFNGWGATLVDSLDSLWIMGFKQDFEDAVHKVGKIDFKTSSRKDIPLFETTIRYLGGLLAAYDVSDKKYSILLDKAVELADIVMGAFDTPNRMPIPYYEWAPSYASQPHRASPHIVMAELGSLAMEFTRLSQLTREHKYYDAITRVTDALEEWQMKTTYPGVWPVKLDASGCKKPPVGKMQEILSDHELAVSDDEELARPDSKLAKRQIEDAPSKDEAATDLEPSAEQAEDAVTSFGDDGDEDEFDVDCEPQGLGIEPHSKHQTYSIGAMADSTYEYFPKMYALLGGLNKKYKGMHEKSMAVIRADFLFRPMIKEKRDVLLLAKHKMFPKAEQPADRKKTIYEGSHLGCFVGGMFALGSKIFDIPSDMELAEKLTDGCVWAYESTPLGIMPELFTMVPCEDTISCKWNETRWHEFLDPHQKERFEAVEQYNKKQEALFATTDKDSEAYEGDPSLLPLTPASEFKFDSASRRKRDLEAATDLEPTKTTFFHPKVALSHSRYVGAKISEERLPPGYTSIDDPQYKLRPEAIESVFVMYRLTGSEIWREKGWRMFQAVERATRTRSGHAVVLDVTSSLGKQGDTMESFWLAETLKYYYLLFSEESLVSLDEWVLNTEAHPFRIPQEGSSF